MEQYRLLDFYGKSITTFAEALEETGGDLGNYEPEFKICGRGYERTVFQPLMGPEILMDQVKTNVMYEHDFSFPLLAANSRDEFSTWIAQGAQPDRPLECLSWDPKWYWPNVANRVAGYVESEGGFWNGKHEPIFGVFVEEAYGYINVMSEARGWRHHNHPETPNDVSSCGFCLSPLTNNNVNTIIELQCGHRCHKRCLFPVLWRDQDMLCPNCLIIILSSRLG